MKQKEKINNQNMMDLKTDDEYNLYKERIKKSLIDDSNHINLSERLVSYCYFNNIAEEIVVDYSKNRVFPISSNYPLWLREEVMKNCLYDPGILSLRNYRLSKKLSQRVLALKLKVVETSYLNWERKKSTPKYYDLKHLQEFFEIDDSDMWTFICSFKSYFKRGIKMKYIELKDNFDDVKTMSLRNVNVKELTIESYRTGHIPGFMGMFDKNVCELVLLDEEKDIRYFFTLDHDEFGFVYVYITNISIFNIDLNMMYDNEHEDEIVKLNEDHCMNFESFDEVYEKRRCKWYLPVKLMSYINKREYDDKVKEFENGIVGKKLGELDIPLSSELEEAKEDYGM